MDSQANRKKQLLRELLRIAQQVRSRAAIQDRRLRLRDVYTLCFELVRELNGRFPDVRIMVGDRVEEHGPVQHQWIEIPSAKVYVDAACEALDPFQPIRAGDTSDPDFTSTYINGVDSNIDVNDPRNRPQLLFKAKSAWDSEG